MRSASTDPCATSGWPAIRPASPSWSSKTAAMPRTRPAAWTAPAAVAPASASKCPRDDPVRDEAVAAAVVAEAEEVAAEREAAAEVEPGLVAELELATAADDIGEYRGHYET